MRARGRQRRMQTLVTAESNGNKLGEGSTPTAVKKGAGGSALGPTPRTSYHLNCSKLSARGFVRCYLSRYRLETRAVGLPGLAHALGDAMSAPAYFISRGYGSPMHLDPSRASQDGVCAASPTATPPPVISSGSRASTTSSGCSPCRRRSSVSLLAQPRVALLLPPAGRRRPPRDAAHAGPRPRAAWPRPRFRQPIPT